MSFSNLMSSWMYKRVTLAQNQDNFTLFLSQKKKNKEQDKNKNKNKEQYKDNFTLL